MSRPVITAFAFVLFLAGHASPAFASGFRTCSTVVEVVSVSDGATDRQGFTARVLLSKPTGGHSEDCGRLIGGEREFTLLDPIPDLRAGQVHALEASLTSDALAGSSSSWARGGEGSAAALALVGAAAKGPVECEVKVDPRRRSYRTGEGTKLEGTVADAPPPCTWLRGLPIEVSFEEDLPRSQRRITLYARAKHDPKSGFTLTWHPSSKQKLLEPPPAAPVPEQPEAAANRGPTPQNGSECASASGEPPTWLPAFVALVFAGRLRRKGGAVRAATKRPGPFGAL